MSRTPPSVLSDQQRQQYDEQGYLVLRGLLDIEQVVEPYKAGHIRFLEDMSARLVAEVEPGLAKQFPDMTFTRRFAAGLGCNPDAIIDRLDPSLTMYLGHFRFRDDLPSAQLPELFELLRNEQILDIVEALIGPEIIAIQGYRNNLKLSADDVEFALAKARKRGLRPEKHLMWGFLVGGATAWHTDASYALDDAQHGDRVAVWLPITEASRETGSLVVLPGTHKTDDRPEDPGDLDIDGAVVIEASPGDVVFFHQRLLHAGMSNKTPDMLRWSANIRYQAYDLPVPQVHLPSFLARSRANPERELRDPELFAEMWRHALEYAGNNLVPMRDIRHIPQEEIDILRQIWPVTPCVHEDWLKLRSDHVDFFDPEAQARVKRMLVDEVKARKRADGSAAGRIIGAPARFVAKQWRSLTVSR